MDSTLASNSRYPKEMLTNYEQSCSNDLTEIFQAKIIYTYLVLRKSTKRFTKCFQN